MGKNSKVTIGYRHFMTLYMGEARTCDYLGAIEIGGEKAYEGEFAGSGDLVINKPTLFGGDKKEGGIVGTLSVRAGEATQMPHPLMQQLVPGPWPAARGLTTTVFDGQVGALNPYVKLWKKRWGGFTAGWTTPVWQPALCRIGRGKNPMHILYQAFTDTVMGMGFSTQVIDEAAWLAAAQTLYDEEFGLCLPFRRSDGGINNYIQTVCDHIGGAWGLDMRTGKITFRLYRKDYVVAALTVLDESNIKRLESFDTPVLDGSVNEVTVVGRDVIANKDISATYHNLANIRAQGRTVPDKRQYPGLWNRDLVGRVAARDCLIASSLLSRVKAVVKGAEFWNTKRGDVYALTWPRKKWALVPVRVLDVDKGERTNGEITLTLMQDFSGMADASYISGDGSQWVPPNETPAALPAQAAYEAPYRALAATLKPADLKAVEPEAGYLIALGARPEGVVAYGYDLWTRVGAAPYDDSAAGDFSPQGLLAAGIDGDDLSVTLTNARDLSLVAVGAEWRCGEEHGRVTSINAVTGVVGIARGCADTVPAVSHAAGARMWFVDAYRAVDPTEYIDGEVVDAKLLCRTRTGTLNEALAPVVSVTMDSRQYRPYPPGKLRVNGAGWPATSFARLALTWTHRDRLLQADQLVDTEAASIGPEPGTTYTVRVYQEGPNTLLHEATGIAGTSYTHDLTAPAVDATVRIEVSSERGGVASRQKHVRLVACECGNKAVNGTFASDTVWTKGTGWSIGAGLATKVAGTASDLSQDIALVAGGTYRIEFTLSGVTAGGIAAGFIGGTNVNGATRNANGTYAETLAAVAGNTTFRLAADATFAGSVDNIVVRRLT